MADPGPDLRPRSLADAGLGAPPSEVFKADGRSRVWRVETAAGARVVKRFEHAPWRQRVALWLGAHPAQRELRLNQRLRADGVAVVPALDAGIEPAAGGARVWLAYPCRGRSLVKLLREGALASRGQRRRAAESLAALTAALLRGGWFNRDFKSSNCLIDERGEAWLIDAGSVRRHGGARSAERMLALLHATTPRRLVSAPERLRFLWRVADAAPQLGDRRALARRLARVEVRSGHGRLRRDIALRADDEGNAAE